MTFRYVDVGGPPGSTYNSSIPAHGFYFGGFGSVLSNWTISRSHIRNVKLPFQIAGASNITIEYSKLGPSWNKETIRGQIRASDIIIRHNIMKDGCRGLPVIQPQAPARRRLVCGMERPAPSTAARFTET